MSRMFFVLMAAFLMIGCSRELNRVGAEPENVVEAPSPWLVSGDCSRNFDTRLGDIVEVAAIDSTYGMLLNGYPYQLTETGWKVVNCVYNQQSHIARDPWGDLQETFPIGSWGIFYNKRSVEYQGAKSIDGIVFPGGTEFAPTDGIILQSVMFSAPNEFVSIVWSVSYLPYDELLEIHVTGISRSRFSYNDSPHIIIDRVPVYEGVLEYIKFE